MQILEFDRVLEEFAANPVNVVCITGSPGTGKTALLHEFRDRAVSSGALYLGASGFQSERAIPFNIVEQVSCCPGIPSGISACLDRLVEQATARGSFTDLPAGTLRSLCEHLGELAGEPRLVIGVDDVQYADPLSLQCLLYLARRSHLTRVLLIVTCDKVPRQFLELPRCHMTETPALTEPEIRRLLELGSDAPVTPDLVRSCYAVSGGNPSLVKALVDDHFTTPAPGTGAELAGIIAGEAFARAYPALLQHRPRLLPVAKAVAVLGPDATMPLVARLLRGYPDELASAINELSASGLLDGLRFRHPAARSAVLAGLGYHERRDLHHRAAKLLHAAGADMVTLADHYLASNEVPDPAVVTVLCHAATQLLRSGDPRHAVRCLRLADRAELDQQQRTHVVMSLANALWRVNPSAAAPELNRLVTAMRADHLTRHHIRTLLTWLLWSGRTQEATEALDRLVATADPDDPGDTDQLNDVRFSLSILHPPSQTRLPPPPPVCRNAVDVSVAAHLEHALHIPISRVELPIGPTEIVRMLDDRDGLIQSLSHSQGNEIEWEHGLLALAYLCVSQNPAAVTRLCDILLTLAIRHDCPTYQAILTSVRADISLSRGDMTGAATHAAAALDLLPQPGWGVAIGWPLSTFILTATAAGRHAESARALRHPVPDEMFQTLFGLKYLQARGRHCLATGRPYAALSDFTTSGGLSDQWPGKGLSSLPWRSSAAEAYLHLNQPSQARELAEQELADLGNRRNRDRGTALRVLAAASEPDERLPLLEEAVRVLRECGSRYELACALADLSHAHRQAGETDQADSVWRRAQHIAAKCGVKEPLCTIPDAGPRRLLTAPRPRDRLSEAEWRVAALVLAGKSNRQIAEDLYLTVSTVEQHLTRIYRKLAVRSRTDLAPVLAQESSATRLTGPQPTASA